MKLYRAVYIHPDTKARMVSQIYHEQARAFSTARAVQKKYPDTLLQIEVSHTPAGVQVPPDDLPLSPDKGRALRLVWQPYDGV